MLKLNKVSVFGTLSEKETKEIEGYFICERRGRKETIFSEGDPSGWLYVVERGKVKITKLSLDGKEIILEIIADNDFFGAVAVMSGFPYPANAVTMEDTVLWKISRSNLMRVLDRFPGVMFNMVQSLGGRIRDFHETTKNIALEKVGSRIAALLLKLTEQAGVKTPMGIQLDLRLTKQDIAEMVGTTVETSIRTMSRFKKLGLIAEKAGRIIVKDPSGLRELGA